MIRMSFNNYLKTQPKATKMLLNSFNKGRLAHAYLFEGERGTPKKELAINFAKLLYCEVEEKPCGMCMNCLRIEHQNHPNVLLLEPEGKTLKKEQITYLQKEYVKTTLEVGPKVYIIDQVDRMSTSAANSILKFIEEPEPNVYTILITDQFHRILPTIVSRCQVINFRPNDRSLIRNQLIEQGLKANSAAIISFLTNDVDVARAMAEEELFDEIIELVRGIGQAILKGDEDPILLCEKSKIDLTNNRNLLDYFLDILLLYMRDIQNSALGKSDLIFTSDLKELAPYVERMSQEWIKKNIKAILTSKVDLENNANTLLLVDSLLIKMVKVV